MPLNEADIVRFGDARRTVDLFNPLDGNTASALDAEHNAEEAAAAAAEARRTSRSDSDSSLLNRSKSETALKNKPRRLASMAKDLRPSDSTGSAVTNTAAGTRLLRDTRGSVGETTTLRPTDSLPAPQPSKSGASRPGAQLHDSITRFEELTREAVYLAHDAADRQRPDEVSRIMEEAAQALHPSSHSRNARDQLRNEPLVDAGGAVPWANALRPKGDDTPSTFSKSSAESYHQPTDIQPLTPSAPVAINPPFRNDPSPYRPPKIGRAHV